MTPEQERRLLDDIEQIKHDARRAKIEATGGFFEFFVFIALCVLLGRGC